MGARINKELRPCFIVRGGGKREKALFHRWCDVAEVHNAVLAGTISGQLRNTFALVELENGRVGMELPQDIQFCDPRHEEFTFDREGEPRSEAPDSSQDISVTPEELADAKTFGERVRLVRKKFGLTQKEFGKLLRNSQSHITNIENDVYEAGATLIRLMSLVYHVQENWLLTGEGSMLP